MILEHIFAHTLTSEQAGRQLSGLAAPAVSPGRGQTHQHTCSVSLDLSECFSPRMEQMRSFGWLRSMGMIRDFWIFSKKSFPYFVEDL